MCTGHITCCPVVSHREYGDGTERRTPDHYIMLALDTASIIIVYFKDDIWTRRKVMESLTVLHKYLAFLIL